MLLVQERLGVLAARCTLEAGTPSEMLKRFILASLYSVFGSMQFHISIWSAFRLQPAGFILEQSKENAVIKVIFSLFFHKGIADADAVPQIFIELLLYFFRITGRKVFAEIV